MERGDVEMLLGKAFEMAMFLFVRLNKVEIQDTPLKG